MKILVTVYVPSIMESFDILVPNFLRIRSVVALIAATVESLSNHRYISSGSECLCLAEKNIMLRHNTTLLQYGVRNGDRLIIM